MPFDPLPDMVVNFTPTGMIPTKGMTPHVPVSPREIADSVLEAAEVGVTMAHLHARSENGAPSLDPEAYGRTIELIREHAPELVICVSLSGRTVNQAEVRAAPLELDGEAKPDMGSLTLSSLNFNATASINAPETIKFLAGRMRERGVKPELEVFDAGMINYARYLTRKGLLSGRHYFNLIVGNIAGAQPSLLSIGHLVNELPEGSIFSLGGVGDCQAQVHALAAASGAGVRVGLEDNIYFDRQRTRLATNLDLIRRARDFAHMCSREIMAPSKLRELLGLAPGNGQYGVAPPSERAAHKADKA